MGKPWFDTARLRMRSWSSRFDLLSYNIRSVGGFRHHPLAGFIGRLRLSSWLATSILTLYQACRNLRLIHDPPRKQTSPETGYCLLVSIRRTVGCLFLLWYVLLAHGIWRIHKFDQRSFRCTFLCVGRYLRVRFLLPASRLFHSET